MMSIAGADEQGDSADAVKCFKKSVMISKAVLGSRTRRTGSRLTIPRQQCKSIKAGGDDCTAAREPATEAVVLFRILGSMSLYSP